MVRTLRARATGEREDEASRNRSQRSFTDSNPFTSSLQWVGKHLNFFRLHLLYFIVTPLVFAAIFHAIDNGEHSFIDGLLLCVSAMTVTGLNPLLMQELNHGQTAIVFIVSTIGSTTGISLIAILIRQYFFLQHFQERIAEDREVRAAARLEDGKDRSIRRYSIRRVGMPFRANNIGEADGQPDQPEDVRTESPSPEESPPASTTVGAEGGLSRANTQHSTKASAATSPVRRQTTRIAEALHVPRDGRGLRRRTVATKGVPLTHALTRNPDNKAMVSGFGGFTNPFGLVYDKLGQRWMNRRGRSSMHRTTTFMTTKTEGGRSDMDGRRTKPANYISFDAVVGRNSRFLGLTAEQRDEMGGVEYRALSVLWKIVLAYILLAQLIPMAIFCPLFGSARYAYLFEDAGTSTGLGSYYGAFDISTGFANAGMSLLDASMVPFQETYGWVLVMAFEILAGNVAFPVFLRAIIWSLSKIVRRDSRLHESLTFLLDHPRRCFFYLFPSYQTWFLVIMLFLISGTEWLFFPILNQGLAVYEDLSISARAIDGLFQSVATRAAGYTIVPLSSLAPAFQVLMAIMMYISVYPIAVSIRGSNVYEEKSLGVYHEEEQEENEEQFEAAHDKLRRPGAYFFEHARRQLAFDGWWLLLALWLICIVERSNIMDPASSNYFDIWTITYELLSAYGTVGLSLGVPYANFSLCGAFRTLSKLILCAVMIRGRHRGLPVAIDRSILLPSDIASISPPVNENTAVDAKPEADSQKETQVATA